LSAMRDKNAQVDQMWPAAWGVFDSFATVETHYERVNVVAVAQRFAILLPEPAVEQLRASLPARWLAC